MTREATARIRTEVRPTEDPEKVRAAIRNIFPDAVFGAADENSVEAESHDLSCFMEHISRQRIRDTVRSYMLKHLSTGTVALVLSKQAAFAGRVSLSEGDGPLGDLEVDIYSEEPEELVRELTEKVEQKDLPDEYEGPGMGG